MGKKKTFIIDSAKWKDKWRDNTEKIDVENVIEEVGKSYSKNK